MLQVLITITMATVTPCTPPQSPGNSTTVIASPLRKSTALLGATAAASKGLLALRGHMRHVKPSLTDRLAREAAEVLAQPGNGWLPLHVLLGLAVNESDLRMWLRLGLDCGITQVRVNQFFRGRRGQRKLCLALSKSSKLSFEYTMRELNRYRSKYCLVWIKRPAQRAGESAAKHGARLRRWKRRQRECVLNIYNQGPRWLTRQRCRLGRIEHHSQRAAMLYQQRKCRWLNRYWLRTMCFARGVQLGRKPRRSCRKALSRPWIERAYKPRRSRR